MKDGIKRYDKMMKQPLGKANNALVTIDSNKEQQNRQNL